MVATMNIKVFSLLGILIFLTACSVGPKPAGQDVLGGAKLLGDSYLLTDNYANHRAQQSYFASSGGQIAYLDYGPDKTRKKANAQVLVMIHGVPTSSWMYRKMIPELQMHYRVIAIDLLGFGSSDKPDAEVDNYSAQKQAAYIDQLLQNLKIKNYNVLFHDMGGLVAWELLAKDINASGVDLQSIDNIILLNTIVAKTGFEHPKMKKGMLAKAMADAYSNELSSVAIIDKTFKNMGLSLTTKLSENECMGYVTPMKEGANNALYEFFTQFDDAFFARLDQQVIGMKDFKGDALVLWGAKDTVLTVDQLPVLKQAMQLPDNSIHIFPNNAHFLAEEIPLTLNQYIINFLRL